MELIPEQIDVGWVDAGYVEGHFALSLASCVGAMSYFGCLGQVRRASSSRPNASRNMIVSEFLEGTAEWLWMVDSDMVFSEQDHPMRLWATASEYSADMVTALTFIHHDNNWPTPSMFLERDGVLKRIMKPVPEEPTEIRACGLASVLINRRVFEAMEAPRDPSMRWFDEIPLPQAEGIAGEDVQFFVRATDMGFRLLIDPDTKTSHIKRVGVDHTAYLRFWELQEKLAA